MRELCERLAAALADEDDVFEPATAEAADVERRLDRQHFALDDVLP